MTQQQHQAQTQTQRQNMYMIQQKLQLLHMMHLSADALEEYVKIQLEENPALDNGTESGEKEEEILSADDRKEHENRSMDDLETYYDDDDYPEYKTYVNNSSPDSDKYSIPIAGEKSFRDQLKEQLSEMNIKAGLLPFVNYLVDSLEEDGYLRRSLSDIADDFGFSEGRYTDESELVEALQVIHRLDPPGLGARSLRECLLLQLKRKHDERPCFRNAIHILEEYFHELSTKNFEKILMHLRITEKELKEAFVIIAHLSPHPVFPAEKTESRAMAIVPEFIVQINDDDLEVSLANNPTFSLKINDQYALQSKSSTLKATGKAKRLKDVAYFRRKVEDAKWFIDALQQREKTFMDVMKTIAVLQRDFLLTGDPRRLKPMILQDITSATGHDLSTISRVTSNKYVQTPYGNFLLKNLFSNSLTTETGEAVSVKEIKEELKDIISAEDKSCPLNDHEIVGRLQEKGFIIARRTVVKYREALNIPNARMRKTLH